MRAASPARTMAAALLILALASCADDATSPPTDGSTTTTAADVGRVVCDAEGTHIETPSVRAQADGVHLVIVNRLGFDTGFSMEFADRAGGGESAPQGESTHVVPAPPGGLGIGCYPDPDYGGEVEHRVLHIVDPDGVYRSIELDCDSVTGLHIDYVANAAGEQGDPVAQARERLDELYGLLDDDDVERAGYPGSGTETETTIRLVRDGRVLATLRYHAAEDGGWLLGSESRCEELQPA